jgi:4-amino-4-deoxy-L-arabinose transferase-like glycosyltransferase
METSAKPERKWADFRLAAIAISAAAVVISVLAVLYTRSAGLRYDEKYYFALARSIAAGVYDDGYVIRPPLYPLYAASMFRAFGEALTPALISQALLRGVLVLQACYMTRRYFSARAGLVAGALLAAYPFLIWVYSRLLNEALYLPLFLLSFHLLQKAVRSGSRSDAFWAGILSGLASLVRATSFFLTIVIAIWFAVRRSGPGRLSRQNLATACLLLLGLVVATAPWTVRNAAVHGAFMPTGNEASFNLYFIVSGVDLDEASRQWESWGTHVERQREGLRRWSTYIAQDPAFHLRRMLNRLPWIFDPARQRPARSLAFLPQAAPGRRHPLLGPILDVLAPGVFLILLVGGLLGLAVLKDDGDRRMLTLIVVLYFILLYAPTIMKARYFLPLTCLLSIYAAGLITAGFDRLRCRPAGRQG